MTKKVKAKDILRLLKARHHEDVFVPECKDGSTWFGSHQRMDAWAMKKSWRNPLTIGYEIKVSRSDFLKDDKWPGYLPYCNQFYFVCPASVMQKNECPEQAGVIHVSTNGSRLMTKKKAPYREEDAGAIDNLFRYILFSRTRVLNKDERSSDVDKAEYWEQWLEDKRQKKETGHAVGRIVWSRYTEILTEYEEELQEVKKELAKCDIVREFCQEHGIDLDEEYIHSSQVEKSILGEVGNAKATLENAHRQIGFAVRNVSNLLARCGSPSGESTDEGEG